MYPCEIQEQPARPTLSIRFRSPVGELAQHFGRIYTAIGQYVEEAGGEHAGPAFATYYNMDMDDLDVEAGFPVAKALPAKGEIQAGEIPGGMFAICHYTGPYAEITSAYEALTQFAGGKGYAPAGTAYEWYFDGPDVPEQDHRTDVAFPVKRVQESV
jgi:effector-binding domain-containing protein